MLTVEKLGDLTGKKVMVRVDFNVPLNGKEIRDDNRIVSALPTIKALVNKGGRIALFSHLGKIKWGKVDDEEIAKEKAKNDMQFVYPRLKELLAPTVVKFTNATHGEELKKAIDELKDGEVLLVQNTRYEKGESKNDPALSADWASNFDVFVMDAFGSAHRAHASTYGVPEILKKENKSCALGYLMEKEVKNLRRCVNPDAHPYVAILGGFKVSDKIKVIDSLLKKCDRILIGGAMAYTFLKALGKKVGNSPVEEDQLDYALKCYASGKIVLPVDTVVADDMENPTAIETVKTDAGIPEGFEGFDVGTETIGLYKSYIKDAKIIFWNGPVGVFEKDVFSKGTIAVCKAITDNKDCFSVIGGGDSAAAAKQFGYADKFSHVSTGGGASLEMIENDGHLPGIDVIGE